LAQVLPHNRFWQARFTAAGLGANSIRTPLDLNRLPFTTKDEILADQAAHPPYGTNLTFDAAAFSRLHQTSGTTGTPLRWLDTPASWDWILDCWRQLFGLMGLRKEDRLIFPFSFGPFLGFWAGFEGASRLGNLCIAAGGMSSQARLAIVRDNQATIVCCTPTYALRLAEAAAEQHLDLAGGSVRAILVAGEPGGNIPATRSRIESAWGARVVDHWGMTELGPLAIEPADAPGGLLMLETECIAEIIDPQTGAAVPAGEEGELVVTNLGRIGSPLLRYRTGDRVRADSELLAGSTHVARSAAAHEQGRQGDKETRRQGEGFHRDVSLSPALLVSASSSAISYSLSRLRPHLLYLPGGILGRTDEMLTIRGNNLYPSALEDIIRRFDGVVEFRVELLSVKAMQHVRVEIEPAPALDAGALASLLGRIAETIKNRWHFQAEVVAAPCGSLPRFEMKAKRFVRGG
jgi:phenylacetate-CoA ligase